MQTEPASDNRFPKQIFHFDRHPVRHGAHDLEHGGLRRSCRSGRSPLRGDLYFSDQLYFRRHSDRGLRIQGDAQNSLVGVCLAHPHGAGVLVRANLARRGVLEKIRARTILFGRRAADRARFDRRVFCRRILKLVRDVKDEIWSNGKHLWMRTIGSTVAGRARQCVFNTIAFLGVLPGSGVLALIVSAFVFKVAYEIVAPRSPMPSSAI